MSQLFDFDFCCRLFAVWTSMLEANDATPIGLIVAGEKPKDGKLGASLHMVEGFPPEEMRASLLDLAKQIPSRG